MSFELPQIYIFFKFLKKNEPGQHYVNVYVNFTLKGRYYRHVQNEADFYNETRSK